MDLSRIHLLHLSLTVVTLLALAACGDSGPQQGLDLDMIEVADVGFDHPVAVVVDTVADVYLVSNAGGRPGVADGSAFISRVSPDGEVLALDWIDPTGTQRPMNSPQGMAIRGDSLIVADLECVRLFHRETAEDMGFNCFDDMTHITDVDVGPEGSVFIVDSGLDLSGDEPEDTGTDAVYRMVMSEGQRGSTLARNENLGHPQGIAVGTRGIFVSTSETGEIFRLTPDGERTTVYPPSGRRLDGIAFTADGGFAFSSQSDETVYLVTGQGEIVRLLQGVPEPGGIAFDRSRNRLIVPLSGEGRILFLDLPSDAPGAAN